MVFGSASAQHEPQVRARFVLARAGSFFMDRESTLFSIAGARLRGCGGGKPPPGLPRLAGAWRAGDEPERLLRHARDLRQLAECDGLLLWGELLEPAGCGYENLQRLLKLLAECDLKRGL